MSFRNPRSEDDDANFICEVDRSIMPGFTKSDPPLAMVWRSVWLKDTGQHRAGAVCGLKTLVMLTSEKVWGPFCLHKYNTENVFEAVRVHQSFRRPDMQFLNGFIGAAHLKMLGKYLILRQGHCAVEDFDEWAKLLFSLDYMGCGNAYAEGVAAVARVCWMEEGLTLQNWPYALDLRDGTVYYHHNRDWPDHGFLLLFGSGGMLKFASLVTGRLK